MQARGGHRDLRRRLSHQSAPQVATFRPGARLTFAELSEHEPLPAVQEDFGHIHLDPARFIDESVASATNGIVVLPPQDGHIRPDEEMVPVTLVRTNDPQEAYARLPNRVDIDLKHHAPGWGRVFFAAVYKRVPSESGTLVFQAPNAGEAEYVAIKQLSKAVVEQYLAAGGNENPYKEIDRMRELGDDVHVLRCRAALQDKDSIFIVTRKACDEHGTLRDVIPWFSNETVDPTRAHDIFKQILDILLYLEEHGFCHRDLSPDNLLFLTPDNLVAMDMALSVRVPRHQHRDEQRHLLFPQGRFGTCAYMSPEVYINSVPYDSVFTDLWSAGVILFNLRTSHLLYEEPIPSNYAFRYFVMARGLSSTPMNEQTVEILMELYNPNRPPVQQGMDLLHRVQAMLNIEPEAVELLEGLFQLNPHDRWTLAQVYLSNYVSDGPHR